MRILSQFSEEEDHARLEPLGVLPATGQVEAGQLPVPLPAPVERHTHHLLPGLTGRLGVGQPGEGADRGGDDAETVVAGVGQADVVKVCALQLQRPHLDGELGPGHPCSGPGAGQHQARHGDVVGPGLGQGAEEGVRVEEISQV